MPFFYSLYNTNYLLFMLPAFVLMLLAQWFVSSAYKTWSQVRSRSHMTGAEAAQRMMMVANIYDVRVEGIPGTLNDHYDPRTKVLSLSQPVALSDSIAALAVAAHELGHAQQDQEGYFPLRFRSALVPAVNIGSNLGWILIIVGLLIQFSELAWVGVLVFSLGAVFAVATLPVELDASARARRILTDSGIICDPDEQRGVNAVLNAAAMTYIAAMAAAVLQLLYFVSMVGGLGGRRRR
jgi:Zn-dependent membrane protease YugP